MIDNRTIAIEALSDALIDAENRAEDALAAQRRAERDLIEARREATNAPHPKWADRALTKLDEWSAALVKVDRESSLPTASRIRQEMDELRAEIQDDVVPF